MQLPRSETRRGIARRTASGTVRQATALVVSRRETRSTRIDKCAGQVQLPEFAATNLVNRALPAPIASAPAAEDRTIHCAAFSIFKRTLTAARIFSQNT